MSGITLEGAAAAEALAGLAQDRAAAYDILAGAFRLPRPGLMEVVARSDVATPFRAAGLDAEAEPLRALAAGAGGLALNVEYTRLFGGPHPAAPPYESVYRDPEGRIMGQATAAAVRSYQAAGLQHDSRAGELPDHVAAELEFLGVLCEEEGRAWAADRAIDAARWLGSRHRFLEEHLLLWFPAFSRRASAASPHPFYDGLLHLTGLFLRREQAWVASLRLWAETEAAANA